MANEKLADAKSGKNDEFYTQYADIQKEAKNDESLLSVRFNCQTLQVKEYPGYPLSHPQYCNCFTHFL